MNVGLRTIIILALLTAVQPGWGMQVRTGDNVQIPAGTTVDDDVAASGGSVNVGGNITGDLLAAGGNISVSGKVAQDATIAGGTLNLMGSIGDDLRAAGGQVNVNGPVADNASLAGGTVILANTARVGRDLHIAGGNLQVDGNIARNLFIAGGQVQINGQIGGDVRADAGQLTIGPNAVIRGDLSYSAQQKISIPPGAQILGRTIYRPQPVKRQPSPAGKFAFWMFSLLALYLVGVLMIALMPRGSEAIADRVLGKPWISLLIGFILLVAMPVAILLITITIIGIPIALILLAAYLISIYLSRAFVGLAIGRWLFGKFGRAGVSPYLALLVGLVVLWLLAAIPIIGGLISFIALLLGLGALAAIRYALVCDLRREQRL